MNVITGRRFLRSPIAPTRTADTSTITSEIVLRRGARNIPADRRITSGIWAQGTENAARTSCPGTTSAERSSRSVSAEPVRSQVQAAAAIAMTDPAIRKRAMNIPTPMASGTARSTNLRGPNDNPPQK